MKNKDLIYWIHYLKNGIIWDSNLKITEHRVIGFHLCDKECAKLTIKKIKKNT